MTNRSCKECARFETCKPPVGIAGCSSFEPNLKSKIEAAIAFCQYIIDKLEPCPDERYNLSVEEVKWEALKTMKMLR